MTKTTIPIASVDRIIRSVCPDTRVSDDAALELTHILEEYGKQISNEALEMCKHAGRQTIRSEDIKLALLRVRK